MLYRITIPVPDYYRTGIFNQHLYIESDNGSPQKEVVLKILQELDSRDTKYPEYTGGWKDAIQSVEQTKQWPRLYGALVETNSFTTIVGLSLQAPISLKLIKPIHIYNDFNDHQHKYYYHPIKDIETYL